MKSAILLCALTMAVGSVARAGMHDVRKCVETNMPRISTVQKILLRVEENGVASFESRLTLYWRKLDDGERRVFATWALMRHLPRGKLTALHLELFHGDTGQAIKIH